MRIPGAAAFGGALYALLLAFGWQMEHWGETRPALALLAAALLAVPLTLLLAAAFAFLERPVKGEDKGETHSFSPVRAFFAMLLCWAPAFVVHFPGSFAYDVPYQLEQFASGAYSSHHPLLHTLLLSSLVEVGRRLGSVNLGAALYTACQMALLAGCYTLALASLARRAGVSAARRGMLFCALYPLHMLMAVNATKDTLFTGCFVLALALLCEALTRGLTAGRRTLLAVALALACLLRNNMTWTLAAFCLVLLLARRVKWAGLCALTLIAAVAASSLLSGALGAVKGDVREALSLPIQQMARASLREREKLSDEDKSAIGDLMPGMAFRLYDATVSDPVKFAFDSVPLSREPIKYLKAYAHVLTRCPQSSLDALLALDHAFLYPYGRYGVSGAYLQTGITEATYTGWREEEQITDASPFPRLRQAIAWRFGAQGAMQIPVVGWLFNMGVIVYLVIFFWLRSLAAGRRGEALAGLLPLLLLGTFLLGPVMAGRYAYPFAACLPFVGSKTKNLIHHR